MTLQIQKYYNEMIVADEFSVVDESIIVDKICSKRESGSWIE
jgi:hypothetical protein